MSNPCSSPPRFGHSVRGYNSARKRTAALVDQALPVARDESYRMSSTGVKKSGERKSFIGSLTGSSSRPSSARKKSLASSTASTDESSAAAATKTEVYREERAAPSDVSPVEMQIGELTLRFENGGWTYTDKTGETKTITAPAPPPATSQADLKEMERLRAENQAVHREVRSGQAQPPAVCPRS